MKSETAFLYRLAHNLAIDWLRRRKVRWDSEERLSREVAGTLQEAANPDLVMLGQSFDDALKELPYDQRTIAQLKLWEGSLSRKSRRRRESR